jgi:hypothetical protein
MDAAYEAEPVVGLADDTPDTLDPPADHPGASKGSWAPDTELPGVSGFFPAELAMVLDCGRGTAAHLAQRAWLFRESLPATWAALADGALDERRARVLADVLAHTAPPIARAVEARVPPEATGLSLGTLKARTTAVLLQLDADAVDARRADAQRQADVRWLPLAPAGHEHAGRRPAHTGVGRVPGRGRPAGRDARGRRRPTADRRAARRRPGRPDPAATRLPPVTARVQVTAPLPSLAGRSTEPGEADGQPITAGHVREVLAQLGVLGLQTPDGGSLTVAITDAEGRLLATASRPTLERLARRGCRDHSDGDCGCPMRAGPRHSRLLPDRRQHEWVHTRDRACRFPHCGHRTGWADLDHVVPHACGGETDCADLCCLCRSHHRLKTFAPGWRFVLDPDGVLHVTTPSGIPRTTHPPGMRPPERSQPPEAGDRPPAAPPDDDPPF